MFESGSLGEPVNFEKAKECFERAANQNNSKAMLNLGNLYEKGKGVEQDVQLAQQWYIKAQSQGDATAQKLLQQGGPTAGLGSPDQGFGSGGQAPPCAQCGSRYHTTAECPELVDQPGGFPM